MKYKKIKQIIPRTNLSLIRVIWKKPQNEKKNTDFNAIFDISLPTCLPLLTSTAAKKSKIISRVTGKTNDGKFRQVNYC